MIQYIRDDSLPTNNDTSARKIVYEAENNVNFAHTFLDTKLTKYRRTKSPAVHVGEVTFIIWSTALAIVVDRVVEVRDQHVIRPLIKSLS